jgi:hypothetical protein
MIWLSIKYKFLSFILGRKYYIGVDIGNGDDLSWVTVAYEKKGITTIVESRELRVGPGMAGIAVSSAGYKLVTQNLGEPTHLSIGTIIWVIIGIFFFVGLFTLSNDVGGEK